MKQLITLTPQTLNSKPIQTVSARELHRFMEVQTLFKDWIVRRIDDYGYQEGKDFTVITGCSNLSTGEFNPNPPKEYHLTLDMAKELAMVERNTMGRVARKYFIKCEQEAREFVPALQEEVLKSNLLWGNILRYHRLGLSKTEIRNIIGVSKDTLRTYFRRMERCGLTEPPQDMERMRKTAAKMNDKQLQLFPVGVR